MDGFLPKPFKRAERLSELSQLVAQRRLGPAEPDPKNMNLGHSLSSSVLI